MVRDSQRVHWELTGIVSPFYKVPFRSLPVFTSRNVIGIIFMTSPCKHNSYSMHYKIQIDVDLCYLILMLRQD